tara:strand:- start:6777 stop:7112 length:336 start_codon:yes stop_codon:yes gene_type:complete
MKYDKDWWDNFREAECAMILSLTKKKNSDYTGGESSFNPFANFDQADDFGVDPITGVNIRMADKFQRAKALCKDGKLTLDTMGDTADDIYRDIIGYSLIILGMLARQRDDT